MNTSLSSYNSFMTFHLVLNEYMHSDKCSVTFTSLVTTWSFNTVNTKVYHWTQVLSTSHPLLSLLNVCFSWVFLQNYWVFGLFPSSGILESTTFRKLDLFPSLGEGRGEDTPSPEDGKRSSFQNVVFSRIPDNGKSPKNPVILCVIHHRQNRLESKSFPLQNSVGVPRFPRTSPKPSHLYTPQSIFHLS
jgi:hypothetical protein